MRITDVEVTQDTDRVRMTASAIWDNHAPDHAYFEWSGVERQGLGPLGDPFLLAFLLPAMVKGEDLVVDAPVSAHLLSSMTRTISTFRGWNPSWNAIRVDAPAQSQGAGPGGDVASFLSGGVDTFFTALSSHPEPITFLITITGLDLRFEKRERVREAVAHTSAAAAELGMRHIVADTNTYEIGHKYLFRAEHHGAVLSAVALGLSGMLRRCYIPTSSPNVEPRPWRTINVALPEWSGPCELVNHGGRVHRRDKLAVVASSDVALRHLRVCLRASTGYNCGGCDKCVLTAVRLQSLGRTSACPTLPVVGPADIRRMRVAHGWLQECRDVRDDTTNRSLRRALTCALWKGRLLYAARPAVDVVRRRRLERRLRKHLPAYT